MAQADKQPALADLFARYLQRQVGAQADGLGFAEPTGEVVPFESVPAQPVEPRLAWNEAIAVGSYFGVEKTTRAWQAPPEWSGLVAGLEPMMAPAFCLGNFPQLVRSYQPLLQTSDLSTLLKPATQPARVPLLIDWVKAQKPADPRMVLAIAMLRLAGHFAEASELLKAHREHVPQAWQGLWDNEEAALAWHQGRVADAARLWEAQPASGPVLFNRGLAALFTGRAAEARGHLKQAAEKLPEQDGWHHLARLYLALAEMRA